MRKLNEIIFVVILVILYGAILFACVGECQTANCGKCTTDGLVAQIASESISSGATLLDESKTVSGAAITTSTLAMMIKSKVPMIIVDCRSGPCEDGKRIPGAKPLTQESSNDVISGTLPSKDMLVVLYDGKENCCARSDVGKKLKELGYTNIIEYPAGLKGWIAAGNEVNDEKKTDTR